tara:strand:- start:71 stop:616 length:546 start_codon:yes stop_codon:yes gene_type:complete
MGRRKAFFNVKNTTIIILIIVVGIFLLLLGLFNKNQTIIVKDYVPNNMLTNPFNAPLKSGNYIPKDFTDIRGVPGIPVNVKTQGPDLEYKQVGILTRINGSEDILPLMGRPLLANRQKWQYHTTSDKQQSVRLPISKGGRSCSGEYGCDEIFNGDTLYVEGYRDTFKATIYENSDFRYIPY